MARRARQGSFLRLAGEKRMAHEDASDVNGARRKAVQLLTGICPIAETGPREARRQEG